MIEIKVILFGQSCLFHWATHVAAVVRDLRTGRCFKVHHPFETDGHFIDDLNASLYGKAKNNCCVGVAILYGAGDFESFVREYRQRFSARDDFNGVTNNCATAVNFVLDYFFSNDRCTKACYTLYQLLCCMCCITTIGGRCFPAPPCIDTPADVLNKAMLLSIAHGKPFEERAQLDNGDRAFAPITRAEEEGNDPPEYFAQCLKFT